MKNKKLFKNILLIVLAVVVLGGVAGGIYYYKSKKTEKKITNTTTTKEETKIDTTGWQTYINNDWGVKFKYPPEFGKAKIKLFKAGDEKVRILAGSVWEGGFTDKQNPINFSILFESRSNDFKPWPRGGSFFDIQSFDTKNDTTIKPFKIIDNDKLNAVILDENSIPKEDFMDQPPCNRGAIVKLKNPNFQGLNISLMDCSIPKETFDAMIESIEIFEPVVQNDLAGATITIKNGDEVKSGTMHRTKIYVMAYYGSGTQSVIYTFNDQATERQEMEEVRLLNFDKENKKILIYYKKWHDICKTGTPENCNLWDYPQWLENGIFNINLVTGTLEKVFDFQNSSYSPQSVVYNSGSRIVEFTETSKNQDSVNVYKINKDGTVGRVIPTISNTDKNWDLVYFPSFVSVEIMNGGNDLCFRSDGTEGSKEWKYDFEGGASGVYSAKCTKDNQDNINFNDNAIIGSEKQEIELGRL